jgi:hypothetical protein
MPDDTCLPTGTCHATGTSKPPPELLAVPTTEQLAGSGTFVPGGVQLTAAQVPNITLAVGQDTELLVPFCVGAGTVAGDYFDFRWYRAGVPLTTYDQTPRLTIGTSRGVIGSR